MPAGKRQFRSYSEKVMKEAIQDVRTINTPVQTAAKMYGVPRITLKYKVEGKSPMERKMGPQTILIYDEETVIANWFLKMAEAGSSVTVKQLQDSVQRFMTDLRRDNPFAENCPGRTWIRGFLRGNGNMSKRISQNFTVSRASVTQGNILGCFTEVEEYLIKKDILEVLMDP